MFRLSLLSLSRLLNPYLHLFLTVALVTIAEILLKQGAMETNPNHVHWLGLSSLPSHRVWVGAALLALSSITWILVLRVLPLYLAFMLSSVVHVTIPVCSWVVLGEAIHAGRWTGIALVLAGIWLTARPASHVEDQT
jgi:undecaprenyl phosphate-alpha-L-ara4N flippase subunit ArnE